MHISAHLFVPIPLFTDMFCYFLYKRYYLYHFSTSFSPTCYIINIHSYRHPCSAFILYLHYHPFSRDIPIICTKKIPQKVLIFSAVLLDYVNYSFNCSTVLSFQTSNSSLSCSQSAIKLLFQSFLQKL